jgi:hypothetical protein
MLHFVIVVGFFQISIKFEIFGTGTHHDLSQEKKLTAEHA